MMCIYGNLGKTPELLYSAKGVAYCRMSVAHAAYDVATRERLPVVWWDVTAFGSLAEHIAESLVKGDTVVVYGRCETPKDSDTDPKQGPKLLAAEVGASLRWTPVTVTRTVRTPTATVPTGENCE